MIYSNELRIGNLVGHHDSDYAGDDDDIHFIGRVIALHERTLHVADAKVGLQTSLAYQEAIPIPLTKEWLTQLGFMFKEYTFELKHQTHCVSISKEMDKIIIVAEAMTKKYDHDYAIIRKALCIHELQNLFFSICGQELTIKETV